MTSGLNHIWEMKNWIKIKQVTKKSQTINIVMYFADLQENELAALLTVMQTLYQESMLEQSLGNGSDIMNEWTNI